MARHSITVTFMDYLGKKANVTLNDPKSGLDASVGMSLKDAEEYANALKAYSRAKVISASHTETIYIDNDETGSQSATTTEAGEHYDRCEQKCFVMFRDADTGRIIRQSIPAPNDNCFDADQEPKSDMAEDIADAIGAASTAESNNLIYLGGGLISKVPSIRKAVRTGV